MRPARPENEERAHGSTSVPPYGHGPGTSDVQSKGQRADFQLLDLGHLAPAELRHVYFLTDEDGPSSQRTG
ncbi:hypothetical protein [Streptomyces virginiae]|uniref:hypothetical protein n=1 Tax=Streptomyces virginiae TaxID=1961 RepID=UPI003255E22C